MKDKLSCLSYSLIWLKVSSLFNFCFCVCGINCEESQEVIESSYRLIEDRCSDSTCIPSFLLINFKEGVTKKGLDTCNFKVVYSYYIMYESLSGHVRKEGSQQKIEPYRLGKWCLPYDF